MQKIELGERVKKNLLDLQHNKYLQYYNTCIIILFTYFIGLIITIITKQVDYTDVRYLFLIAIITIAVATILILLMLKFKWHLTNILEEIKKLNL